MFLEELNAAPGEKTGAKQLRGFSPEAIDQLAAYAWPGNIDELASIVRQAYDKAEGQEITPADLPERIYLAAHATRHARRPPQPIELERVLADIESELIARAMRLAKGNKTKAARLLGLTRRACIDGWCNWGWRISPSALSQLVSWIVCHWLCQCSSLPNDQGKNSKEHWQSQ